MRRYSRFLGFAFVTCLTSYAHARQFCAPAQRCWPTDKDWQRLRASLHGKLEEAPLPIAACKSNPTSACTSALSNIKNPYFNQDQAGGTESAGWLDAWVASPSRYAVVAEGASDVAAAVDFARAHNLRLVVKGTGHDYLGRSNAPDSLLVWTHAMRAVQTVDAFVPAACPSTLAGVPAVTVEAGARWLEAYDEVTVKHGRYVQGGGCTTVGAAGGFLQGGGFGSWSKRYGIAAASMLEAEVVTADGKLRVANACQNQDLFWALRGGGGGTYGVVTKVTLMTHPLPKRVGWVNGTVEAKSGRAFRALIEKFLGFYYAQLNNEHWGEQFAFDTRDHLNLSLTFESLSAADAERLWKPFRDWLAAHKDAYVANLKLGDAPGEVLWNIQALQARAPDAIRLDDRPGAPPRFWWRGDSDQISVYWYAYQSRWIPIGLFAPDKLKTLTAAVYEASRIWDISFHVNKGQAGAAADAVRRDRETSMNPAVLDAAALVILGAGGEGLPGVKGHEPDAEEARGQRARVSAAMKVLRDATPGAGSYVNETDYFEPDWQHSFWGSNYEKLLAIKRKYDPEGLFTCHHCVGSDDK